MVAEAKKWGQKRWQERSEVELARSADPTWQRTRGVEEGWGGPCPSLAPWRNGPCSRMRCPLNWHRISATTRSNRRYRAWIDSAHGSRQGLAVSPVRAPGSAARP